MLALLIKKWQCAAHWLDYIKVIPQKSKLLINFFETFPEFSLPSTVSKNAIKMIGHPARFRDVSGQSYPINACTLADRARYTLVQVTFCGSWKHNFFKQYLGKNLTSWKCRAYGTISYEICWKSHHLKWCRRKGFVQSLFLWS